MVVGGGVAAPFLNEGNGCHMMFLMPLLVTAIVFMTTAASAQDKNIPGQSPPAQQSAPAQSSHAPGHDAQSGKPETGETTGQGGGQTNIEADNKAITQTSPSK